MLHAGVIDQNINRLLLEIDGVFYHILDVSGLRQICGGEAHWDAILLLESVT